MSHLSPVEFLETRVLPRLDVASVYADVKFTTRGKVYWRGPCPLHGGEGANFSVDARTLRYRCFSHCGGGSVVDFVCGGAKVRGGVWVEGVKKLAALAGADAAEMDAEFTPERVARIEKARRHGDLLEDALDLFRAALAGDRGSAAREYLVRRLVAGVDPTEFDFGYHPGPDVVVAEMVKRGYDRADVETAGLLSPAWSNRLVGAWRDRRGNLRSMFARDLSGAVSAGEKYLVLRGTKKAKLVLFALDVAMKALGREGHLVVGEGYFDALVPQSAGFLNVAAVGGGGQELTAERFEKLARVGVREITLILDFDPSELPCEAHASPWCRTCPPGVTGTAAAAMAWAQSAAALQLYVVRPVDLFGLAGSPGGSTPAKVDLADAVQGGGLRLLHDAVGARIHALHFLAEYVVDRHHGVAA